MKDFDGIKMQGTTIKIKKKSRFGLYLEIFYYDSLLFPSISLS